MNIKFPCGMFKNQTIEDVFYTQRGRQYILWCDKEWKMSKIFGDEIHRVAKIIKNNCLQFKKHNFDEYEVLKYLAKPKGEAL